MYIYPEGSTSLDGTTLISVCVNAQYIREAKAVTSVLGGIDALISLMKRVNRRYQVRERKCEKAFPGTRKVSGMSPEAYGWTSPEI